MSWCELDFTSELTVVTWTIKMMSNYNLESVRCKRLTCDVDIS